MKRIRSPILLLLFTFMYSLGYAQYAGGDGYGSISLLLSQASCSAPVYPAIFTGGDESSTAGFQLQQASCVAAAMPSVFAGGDENSASSILLTQVSCAAPV